MVFWVVYAFSALVTLLAPGGRIFLGSLGMALYWLVLLVFRSPLKKGLSRVVGSFPLRFFAIGLISADVIMENLAINFKGDLDPNLIVNTFLWLGSCIGLLTGWWVVARFYRFTPYQVFFITGLTGVLVEHNAMFLRLLVGGKWGIALLSAPIIVVVYGAAVAPAFLLAGDPPETKLRKPSMAGFAVALLLPGVLFYGVGALWIALLHPLVAS